jgi:Transposase
MLTASPLPLLPTLTASLQAPEPGLRIGVDTHADVHVAAAIDELGRPRATISVPTTLAGLQRLHTWARQLGPVVAWGVEGTGSYGARLARLLSDHGETVLEVSRPDRRLRRDRGKSDPIDRMPPRGLSWPAPRSAPPRPAVAQPPRCGRLGPPGRPPSRHAPRPPTSSGRCCWIRLKSCTPCARCAIPADWPAAARGSARRPAPTPSTCSSTRCAVSHAASGRSTKRSTTWIS